MTRCGADAAALLGAVAGPDPADPATARATVRPITGPAGLVAGLPVGLTF